MVMVVMLMLFLKCLYSIIKSIFMLHSSKNILSIKAIPGGSYDNCIRIMLAKKSYALGNFLISCTLSMRKHDRGCVLDLIVVELAEVLHIHLALVYVCNGGKAIKLCTMLLGSFCRANNVGKLANARGLNNNSIGIILLQHLYKRLGEISDERTTDTT